MNLRRAVIVEGSRTPFLKAGTDFKDLMAFELGALAIRGLLRKTQLDGRLVDRVIMGNTIANVSTSNVAREAALNAGVANTAVCNTVSLACISANQAICQGVDQIMLGHAEVVIAGGTDSVSDIPITLSKEMRQKMFKARKVKGFGDYLKLASDIRPADFSPEVPDISEYTTGRTMGQDCDRLADRIGVSREEQDEFAVRSHQLAHMATQNGILENEIGAADIPPSFMPIRRDNGIRGDSSMERLAKLGPAFTKPHGTLTAANSSFLTDGAAAVLLMSEDKARELGMKVKAYVKQYVFTGQDLEEELLLGPAYATPKVLDRAAMSISDIDVFEYHEAFAGQILANLKCLASDEFAQDKLGRSSKVGEIDMGKFNLWGGSLAIGHPFAATGARLVNTAANRLIAEDGQYALIAACAGGAHGHAMILERA